MVDALARAERVCIRREAERLLAAAVVARIAPAALKTPENGNRAGAGRWAILGSNQ